MSNYSTPKDLLSSVFSNLTREEIQKRTGIFSHWTEVVSRVSVYGERLASHTKVKEFEKGIVFVETDHSGWIQILLMNRKYILKGLQMAFPDVKSFVCNVSSEKPSSKKDDVKISKAALLEELEKRCGSENIVETERVAAPVEDKKFLSIMKSLEENIKKSGL